jgi:hypothetical protein
LKTDEFPDIVYRLCSTPIGVGLSRRRGDGSATIFPSQSNEYDVLIYGVSSTGYSWSYFRSSLTPLSCSVRPNRHLAAWTRVIYPEYMTIPWPSSLIPSMSEPSTIHGRGSPIYTTSICVYQKSGIVPA